MYDAIDLLCREREFSGALLLTREGEAVDKVAMGFANREAGVPVTPETTFYVASVTKQFTACCVMLLAQDGRLSVRDTLDKYIPEYVHASEMTLFDLLHMRGGVPDALNDVLAGRLEEEKKTTSLSPREFALYSEREYCAGSSMRQTIDLANAHPLRFAPGTQMHYSNTEYRFLGEVVERVSGLSLEEFMRSRIWTPLGMTRTGMGRDRIEAVSYLRFEGDWLPLPKPDSRSGAGSVVSTVGDLTRWLYAVMEGRLLDAEGWKDVFTYLDNYGMGWQADARMPRGWHGHSGSLLGYRSRVFFEPARKRTIAFLANAEPQNPSGDDNQVFDYVLCRLADTE